MAENRKEQTCFSWLVPSSKEKREREKDAEIERSRGSASLSTHVDTLTLVWSSLAFSSFRLFLVLFFVLSLLLLESPI